MKHHIQFMCPIGRTGGKPSKVIISLRSRSSVIGVVNKKVNMVAHKMNMISFIGFQLEMK